MLLTRPSTAVALALAACAASDLAAQQPTRSAPVAHVASTALPIDRVMAVVGTRPILLSEVMDFINGQRARGMPMPTDSASYAALEKSTLDRLIDDEVLVGAAKQYKIEATDAEVSATADKAVKQIKGTFKTDAEFRDALKSAGFGNENEFRKFRIEQDKRDLLMERSMDSLRAHGRMSAPVNVTEAEITAAFPKAKDAMGKRPATISFRQIVVPPRPTPAFRKAALAKADSLLLEVEKGGDFEKIAKRETMDPTTKETGGDLGWNRPGMMVPEFDRAMFSLRPGQVYPAVVETPFGFHIVKVDRVNAAEVKARHILIVPHLDSSDVARARLVADTVLRLWKSGTPFDSLVARYHDSSELKGFPDGYIVDSLPEEYKKAVAGVKTGEFTAPFEIPNPRTGFAKVGILLLTDRVEGGEYTQADLRDRIRQQLQQEKQGRRMLDQLRKEQSVLTRP
ncbi:MAG: peptidylprolyl isomerase [Gemmatimonadales bacterium]